MTIHPTEIELHDYSDGTLSEPRHSAVRAHMATCAECASAAQRLATLVADLRALPRDIAPPRDLLSDIHARIDALPEDQAAVTLPAGALPGGADRTDADVLPLARPSARHGERRLSMRWLAAAAVLLIALSSATTLLVVRRITPAGDAGDPLAGQPSPTYDSPAAAQLVAVRVLERSYLDAIAELQSALAEPQVSLAPETVRLLEENLAIIDLALVEARAALLADPASPALAELLRAGYERKLDVLRSARGHATVRARG